MSEYQGNPGDIENQVASQERSASSSINRRDEERNDPIGRISANILENGDSVIYAIVGICFLAGGLIALGYSFWDLIVNLTSQILTPPILATSIIQFVSDLLLVLIIMEVLGTVTNYLESHTTSLRPFLFIGIVSATRGILSIGARLSVGTTRPIPQQDFVNDMIELGVNGAVILALGITLKLLGKLVQD
jgi:uncharacterized membrane protein (DUF373 family)